MSPGPLQRVSFAKSASHAVAPKKGGKGAKGKPPKAPAAVAAGGDAAAKAKQPADAAAAGGRQKAAAVDVGEPNAKLFVENLPAATTAAMLEMLFQQFPGEAGWMSPVWGPQLFDRLTPSFSHPGMGHAQRAAAAPSSRGML